jgi:hypothetical protein
MYLVGHLLLYSLKRQIGLTVSEHGKQKMEYICSDLFWSIDYCSGFTGVDERSLEVPVLQVLVL